jgi:hypothetical protein
MSQKNGLMPAIKTLIQIFFISQTEISDPMIHVQHQKKIKVVWIFTDTIRRSNPNPTKGGMYQADLIRS